MYVTITPGVCDWSGRGRYCPPMRELYQLCEIGTSYFQSLAHFYTSLPLFSPLITVTLSPFKVFCYDFNFSFRLFVLNNWYE